jgi:hypothetical protein
MKTIIYFIVYCWYRIIGLADGTGERRRNVGWVLKDGSNLTRRKPDVRENWERHGKSGGQNVHAYGRAVMESQQVRMRVE